MASNVRSSSPGIEELVEKLRSIKETNPELYNEAWTKISHKTRAAILQYEANEKSSRHPSETHHKSSHEADLASSPRDHSQTPPKHLEDQHRNPQTRHGAKDWEAPARSHEHQSHSHQSTTLQDDKPIHTSLSSPVNIAAEESQKIETIETRPETSTNTQEETEKALRTSVSAQIPKAHQIMKEAAKAQHLPTSLQEVLLATTVYELELIRISIDKLTKRLETTAKS